MPGGRRDGAATAVTHAGALGQARDARLGRAYLLATQTVCSPVRKESEEERSGQALDHEGQKGRNGSVLSLNKEGPRASPLAQSLRLLREAPTENKREMEREKKKKEQPPIDHT